MPWQGWPPAPARPTIGDGSPTNSLAISVISVSLPACPSAKLKLSLGLVLGVAPGLVLADLPAPRPASTEEVLMEWRNEEFDFGGVNHLALVCSDMKRTVAFYTQVLGMRLIKTIELPAGA